MLVKIFFQQRIAFILEKYPGTVGIADVIAVHNSTKEVHDANLHKLMLVALQHRLVFNLDKCMIEETKITFFGMVFDAKGIHPDSEKEEAVRAIPEPQDNQDLQSFLGMATYMVPFIPKLSAMSEALRKFLRKSL